MKALITLDRLDRDHRLLDKREVPSRSFLFNLIKGLYAMFSEVQYQLTDIDSNARNIDGTWHTSHTQRGQKTQLLLSSPAGASAMWGYDGTRIAVSTHNVFRTRENRMRAQDVGIQVGRGAASVSLDDYALQTRISHGRGANQFEIDGCAVFPPTFAHPTGETVVRRYFNNNSGASITVNEVGLYSPFTSRLSRQDDMRLFVFCIARDLVAPGLDVDDGELLRVTYTIEIEV